MTMHSTPTPYLRYNMNKGLWETHPSRWVEDRNERNFTWVAIGFPFATQLERGVSGTCQENE
jgi:hypothetical protein